MTNPTMRDCIVKDLLIPSHILSRIIQRAPYTYKVYYIKKKNNGRRIIAQPAKETKYIQYWIIKNIISKLPIHDAATAYRPGSSIKSNISAHKGNEFISKFDFKDFFTSIKFDHIKNHICKHLGNDLNDQEINDIVRVCCINPKNKGDLCLSIGAPSSPIISNTIMYEFDVKVSRWCMDNGFIYTRYADDLTFSTNQKFSTAAIEPFLREVVRNLEYPRLRFNRKKTLHLSKKHQRKITGLILTNEGKISLGREKKRIISSLIHKYKLELLEEDDILKLQGLIAHAKDVEPSFIYRMRSKYGSQTISCLLRKRKARSRQPD